MRRRAATLALAALLLPGCRGDARRVAATAAPDARPIDLAGAPAPRLFVGVVAPRVAVDVTSPFTTLVAAVDVLVGAKVEAGAPLLRLDPRPLREQIAIANAALRRLNTDRGGATLARRKAEAALEIERKSFADGVSSKAALVDAEYAAQIAASSVAAASAAIAEQSANLAKLEALLQDSTLRAPIAGTIAMRYADVGARVTEGAPLVRVISEGDVVIKFAMPAGQDAGVVPGATVEVELAGRARRASALVTAVAPELDPVAQMILAEATFAPGEQVPQAGTVCHIVVK